MPNIISSYRDFVSQKSVTGMLFHSTVKAGIGAVLGYFALTDPISGMLLGAAGALGEDVSIPLWKSILDMHDETGKVVYFAMRFFTGLVVALLLTSVAGYSFVFSKAFFFSVAMSATLFATQYLFNHLFPNHNIHLDPLY